MSSRYTDDSLRGIWGDVVFLSQTEYLVCTFSSQVRATCNCSSGHVGVAHKLFTRYVPRCYARCAVWRLN